MFDDFEDELYNNTKGLQDEVMKIAEKAFVEPGEEGRLSLPDTDYAEAAKSGKDYGEARYSLSDDEISGIIEQSEKNFERLVYELHGFARNNTNMRPSGGRWRNVRTAKSMRELLEVGGRTVQEALQHDLPRKVVSEIFTKVGRLDEDERKILSILIREAGKGLLHYTYFCGKRIQQRNSIKNKCVKYF